MVNSRFSISLHILALLANEEGKWTSSAYIASSVNTNPAFIRRLLAALKRAGLVETRNGPDGGAALGKPAERITLDEVFEATIEGGLYALHSDCNPQCPIGRGIERSLRGTFSRWESGLHADMAEVTVAEVLAGLKVPRVPAKKEG